MHLVPPVRQRHGHGGGQCGLAHTTLAHEHDQAVAVLGDLIHEPGQVGRQQREFDSAVGVAGRGRGRIKQLAQGIHTHQVEGLERHLVQRQRTQVFGQGCMVYALGRLSPLVVGLALLTQPVVAATVGWLVYAERLGLPDMAGAVLVAVALVLVRERKREVVQLAPAGAEDQ